MELGNVLMSSDSDELGIIINFSRILPHSSVPSFLTLLGSSPNFLIPPVFVPNS